MNTTDSAGNQKMVSGLVEYATVKNGETLLSINDTYYPASDLDSVVDYDYFLYLQEKEKQEAAEGTDSENSNTENSNTENSNTENSTDKA